MNRYRLRLFRLLRSMRTELFLAERDFGVKLTRRHDDLKWQHKGRADVLRKLLAEEKREARRKD